MQNNYRVTRIVTLVTCLVSKTVFSSGLLATLLFFIGIGNSFAAPGDLDASFGSGGKVTTPVGTGRDLAQAVALQPDGKIVLAGYARNDFAVVRYNPDGSLDTGFGTGGKVLTPVGAGNDEAYAVAIQTDGKIVLAGYASGSFAVVRYHADGSLDAGFGTGGKAITPISGQSFAQSVVIQPDGKIIAAGWSGSVTKFSLVRYNGDGSLDAAFGTGGKVVFQIGTGVAGDLAHALALQPDGKILIGGGGTLTSDTPTRFSLARLDASGALDSSFGAGGKVVTAITSGGSSSIYDIAIQTDGKIVASGNSSIPNSGTADTAVARYHPNGSLDAGFGMGGIVTTRVGTVASNGEAVAIQANGKIVVAGSSFSGPTADRNDFGALRLNPNGSIDAAFGMNGKVITPIGSRDDQVRDALIQPDGKIIVAGHSEDAADDFDEDFAVVRYLGDATAPRPARFDFDGDGRSDYGVFRPATGTWYLLNSQSGFSAAAFGASSDRLVPADYDGDGKTDIAVYRAGTWYLQRSAQGFVGVSYGDTNDIPVPADYDGDGKAELAVFRPANGTWYLYNLATNQASAAQFGTSGDKPVPADFDGDGKTDIAVFRPSNGAWYLNRSQLGFTGVQFGLGTDKPVAADYDGDGKADVAVARQSGGITAWYVLGSTQGFYGAQFGADTDRLVPGDYDGDGKTDIAVWRSSDGVFYVLRSSGNQLSAAHFGHSGDAPIAAAFVR